MRSSPVPGRRAPWRLLLIPAHGGAPGVRTEAAGRGLDVIDATSRWWPGYRPKPPVRRRPDQAWSSIGQSGLAVLPAILGERLDHAILADRSLGRAGAVQVADPRRVSYVLLLGVPVEDTPIATAALRSRFPALRGPDPDGFCYAASDRAETVRTVASSSDLVLVLGTEDDPDTRHLTALARSNRAKANVIADVTEIIPSWLAGTSAIGLAESTAAAPGLAARVTEALSGLGPLSVTRRLVSTEVTSRAAITSPAGRRIAAPPGLRTGSRSDIVAVMLFPTSLVGSYPQPDWLIDRARLRGRFPPRVRATELWRVGPEYLEQAQRDGTELAIRAQERAGLDILTDGEIRRESYSNRFATALDGVDIDNPGTALDRSGQPNPVPRVTGPIRRRHPVEVEDVRFLRASTSRTIKITVPGPFTMAQQAQNDYYSSTEDLALGYSRRSTKRSRTCSRRVRTSSSSTSPTCRPVRTRPASTACG